MKPSDISPALRRTILSFQKEEVNSAAIYTWLARRLGDSENGRIIDRIAADEFKHAARWQQITGRRVKPSALKVAFFVFLARLLGITFAVRLLEKSEAQAQTEYAAVLEQFPDTAAIMAEETRHEEQLIAMIDEERLRYAGSVVLGLNDALIELTGALAGYTLAFQNTRIIALTGLITGVSAAFSMAASEYLSQRSDAGSDQSPFRSALYTGTAYIITVAALVAPFFVFASFLTAFAVTLGTAILIILCFNFYISTAKDLPFRRHFLEMLVLSLGVTALSFGVGLAVKHFLGLEL